jgi:hypothetical protein
MTFSRWFKITQPVAQIINTEGDAYFIDPSGNFYDMQSRVNAPVSVVVNMPALHWGLPDTLKRYHWIYGRAKVSGALTFTVVADGHGATNSKKLVIRPRWKSAFNCTLNLQANMDKGQGDYLHRFEAELESRYTDRIKQP